MIGDTWYHIAVDKDSTGKVRIYVDGVMKASDTPANSVIVSTRSLTTITVGGAGADDQNPFKGNIDEVRITTVSRYGDLYGDASVLGADAASSRITPDARRAR